MFLRILMMLVVLFSVSACSSTDEEGTLDDIRVEQGAAGGPLDGTQVNGAGYGQGAAPGTQQDLVVNVGDRVFFGYDRFDLTREGQSTLDRQAAWMKQYPNVNVTIEGHCDERGTREYNLALGERRASSVKNYLIALGVPATRINTISYGKERPAVLGSDEESWAQNRRGVTIVE